MEAGVVRKLPGHFSARIVSVNGIAGALGLLDGRPYAATSFETDGRRILSVMRVLNPAKLAGLVTRFGRSE
jgi:RNA polymerase sigma-70 factor (ECF subfamily)